MKKLLTSELYKIWKNKIIFIMFTVILSYDLLYFGILYVEYYYGGKITTGAEAIVQKGFDEFLLIAIAVVIANIVGIDFQTMAIKNVVAKGYSRQQIYFAKIIICMLVSVSTMVISRVIVVGLTVLVWGFDDTQIFTCTGVLLFSFTYTILSASYGAVFVMLTFEAKSISRSIVYNVLFLILCPLMLRIICIIIGHDSILSDYYLVQCMEKMATYSPLAKDTWRCVFVFFIYTALSIYIGVFRFMRKDIKNL